jgi:hypothetical protein
LFRTLSTWLTWCVAELDERPDFIDGGTFTHSGDVTLNGGGDLSLTGAGVFSVDKTTARLLSGTTGISVGASSVVVDKDISLQADLVVEDGQNIGLGGGGSLTVRNEGELHAAAGSIVNLQGDTTISDLTITRDVSPMLFSADGSITATNFGYRDYVFTGLTAGRQLDITATPVQHQKFTVHNNSASHEATVIVNSVTLGYVGGGGGAPGLRIFYFDGYVWNVS